MVLKASRERCHLQLKQVATFTRGGFSWFWQMEQFMQKGAPKLTFWKYRGIIVSLVSTDTHHWKTIFGVTNCWNHHAVEILLVVVGQACVTRCLDAHMFTIKCAYVISNSCFFHLAAVDVWGKLAVNCHLQLFCQYENEKTTFVGILLLPDISKLLFKPFGWRNRLLTKTKKIVKAGPTNDSRFSNHPNILIEKFSIVQFYLITLGWEYWMLHLLIFF